MAEFVLKNYFFEFNSQIKQQISGTAIGTKCASTYGCIFIDKVETEVLETQRDKPFCGLDILTMFSSFGRMIKNN